MGRPPRFVADAMLGSLARKLRIFGFDTLYFKDGGDSELLKLAKSEGRILLTSDDGPLRPCIAARRRVVPRIGQDRQVEARLAPKTGSVDLCSRVRFRTPQQVRGVQRRARRGLQESSSGGKWPPQGHPEAPPLLQVRVLLPALLARGALEAAAPALRRHGDKGFNVKRPRVRSLRGLGP